MAKKRIVKDYLQLPDHVRIHLRRTFPDGFSDNLIKFKDAKGKQVSALAFETEDIYYLVRMTVEEAIQIVEEEEEEVIEEAEIDFKLMDDSKKEAMADLEEAEGIIDEE